MKDKEKQTLKFSVIDNKTGEYPDLYNIALKEDWAKDLMYCDMEGFSINEDGQLILSDECGKFVYCPSDRFTVVFEDSVVLSREEYERLKHYEWRVTSGVCMTQKEWFDFCNEDSNRRTCLRIEEREKERKETAEKILNEIYAVLWDEKTPIANSFVNLDVKIREIATREGVKIKG